MKELASSQSKRLAYIDMLECIAIILMLTYHGYLFPSDITASGSVEVSLNYLFSSLLSPCVPLFFFANGYLLFWKEFDLKKHYLRILRMSILMVIWGVINIAVLQFTENRPLTVSRFISTLWYWEQSYVNHFWFMHTLIALNLFFPVFKLTYDGNKRVFTIIAVMTVLLTIGNRAVNEIYAFIMHVVFGKTDFFTEHNFFNFLNPLYKVQYRYAIAYFLTGGMMCMLKQRIVAIPAKVRNWICGVGILLSCIGLWGTGYLLTAIHGELQHLVFGGYESPFTYLNVLFIYTLCLNWQKDNAIIKAVSGNTLAVYYMHGLFYSVFNPIMRGIPAFANVPVTILYALSTLAVCVTTALLLRKIPIISKIL